MFTIGCASTIAANQQFAPCVIAGNQPLNRFINFDLLAMIAKTFPRIHLAPLEIICGKIPLRKIYYQDIEVKVQLKTLLSYGTIIN